MLDVDKCKVLPEGGQQDTEKRQGDFRVLSQPNKIPKPLTKKLKTGGGEGG